MLYTSIETAFTPWSCSSFHLNAVVACGLASVLNETHDFVGAAARPFRLSCVALAMMNDVQTFSSLDCAEEDTIASVYNGSAGKYSVSQWIHEHRNMKSMRDLYSSDEPEACFLVAIKAGAQIPRTHVCFVNHQLGRELQHR